MDPANRSLPGTAVTFKITADFFDAGTHIGQTIAGLSVGKSAAIIFNDNTQYLFPIVNSQPRLGSPGMFGNVVQSLANDQIKTMPYF